MLALLSRRRPAARTPYLRRPALEHLEARNSPSLLDPTLSLTSPDLSTSPAPATSQPLTAPALTTTAAADSGTTSPAPATGSFLAALVAPAVPAPGPAAPAGSATGPVGLAAPGRGTPAPVIDSCAAAENADLMVTVTGHVTYVNPTSLTVAFTSSWAPINGLHTAVDAGGNFTITFNVPYCSSASTASHTATAVASDGAGHVSAPYSFIIEQTPG